MSELLYVLENKHQECWDECNAIKEFIEIGVSKEKEDNKLRYRNKDARDKEVKDRLEKNNKYQKRRNDMKFLYGQKEMLKRDIDFLNSTSSLFKDILTYINKGDSLEDYEYAVHILEEVNIKEIEEILDEHRQYNQTENE